MNQRVGDVRASLELSIKLLEGRRGRGESSSRKSNPLTLISRSIGSQPCEISASVRIPLVDNSHPGRSENLAKLRAHGDIGASGRKHILSVQNPALHQERPNPSLQDIGRFQARQLAKGRAHIAILRHFGAEAPIPPPPESETARPAADPAGSGELGTRRSSKPCSSCPGDR
jgi:hypothetical protein